jgi:hypothetical protein
LESKVEKCEVPLNILEIIKRIRFGNSIPTQMYYNLGTNESQGGGGRGRVGKEWGGGLGA